MPVGGLIGEPVDTQKDRVAVMGPSDDTRHRPVEQVTAPRPQRVGRRLQCESGATE